MKVGKRLSAKFNGIESAYDETQKKVLTYDSVKYERKIESHDKQIKTLEELTLIRTEIMKRWIRDWRKRTLL